MIRGPDWEDVERGQGHSQRLTMRVDTAARALEKVLGSPNAMSTQGQQGAPQGGCVRQLDCKGCDSTRAPGRSPAPTLLRAVSLWQGRPDASSTAPATVSLRGLISFCLEVKVHLRQHKFR